MRSFRGADRLLPCLAVCNRLAKAGYSLVLAARDEARLRALSDELSQGYLETPSWISADPTIGRAEALRRSMLALMDDPSSPGNAHAAIWAPFMVVGEGGREGL